jgi:putative membrane protein
MATKKTHRFKAYTFPLALLIPFFLYWVYTGFVANDMLVWMADAAFNLTLLIVLITTYRRFSLSKLSYLYIFIYLMLAQTGIRYNYELVPYNEWTQGLFGFELNEVFGFQRNQYDRFVHFCFGLLIYFPVYDCMRFAGPPLKPRVRHFFAFSIINGASAIYEVIELIGGSVFVGESYLLYHGMQGDVLDPPKDMALALAGAIVAIAIMLAYDTRRRMISASLLLILILASCGAHAQTPESQGASILEKAFKRYEANSIYTEMTMKVVRPKWESELRFKAWTKSPQYALVLITEPARESGQTFLKRGGELWHYLPNIEKTVKLSAGLMTSSWMGSDFSIDDVLQNLSFVTDYVSSMIGQDHAGWENLLSD